MGGGGGGRSPRVSEELMSSYMTIDKQFYSLFSRTKGIDMSVHLYSIYLGEITKQGHYFSDDERDLNRLFIV